MVKAPGGWATTSLSTAWRGAPQEHCPHVHRLRRDALGCTALQLFIQSKVLGWRAIDRLRLVFLHRTYRTELSPTPVPSVY